MLAAPQAPLPTLPFHEVWRLVRPTKDWNRGFTDTAVIGSCVLFVEETGRDKGAYGALDTATGKRLWSWPFVPETSNYLQAFAPYAVITGAHRVLVFDPKNGCVVWQGWREGFGGGPVIAGDRLFAELKQGVLTAIDLRSHHLAWRKPFSAHLYTKGGLNRLKAVADTLCVLDEKGMVTCLAQADGRVLWSRHFSGGEGASFVGVQERLVICGTNANEAWRLRDGAPLWRTTTGTDYTSAFSLPSTEQVWKMPDSGRLIRIDARNGRTLADTQALPDRRGGAFGPVVYRGGVLAYTGKILVRIDAHGRSVAQFDPQESLYDLHALGADLLVRSKDGVARLTPGAPPLPADPVALAQRLVAKDRLTPEDRRALLRLGRAALPAIEGTLRTAWNEQGETLAGLLVEIADRRDTARMFDMGWRKGVFGGYGRIAKILGDWLMTTADPDLVAQRLLPRFQEASSEGTEVALVPFLLRSTETTVIDALLARLKAPLTPQGVKGEIYGGIAASGRNDVLDEILRVRAQGRRLDAPNPLLTLSGDRDGDGIPDRLDANPLVPPRTLTEVQRVLFAAFDARYRFEEGTDAIGIVDYPPSVAPFELVGWKGGLIPASMSLGLYREGGYAKDPVPFMALGFTGHGDAPGPVVFNPGGDEATVELSEVPGPLGGRGYEAKLRKIRGEWFVVSLRMTWIS